MALHQQIQRLLLLGVRLERSPRPAVVPPPERMAGLVTALRRAHGRFDERAIEFGHRYRSGYWMIYLLSAFAVLCAVLPLALGWDSPNHAMHPWIGLWPAIEIGLIAAVGLIYWRGNKGDWQGEWLRARTTAELSWYLPLLAPLAAGAGRLQPSTDGSASWYAFLDEMGQPIPASTDVADLCAEHRTLAEQCLAGAWSDPVFCRDYAAWAMGMLREQQVYHHDLSARQHALQHRVHQITGALFILTAIGALMHLAVHSRWLSVMTSFFPALAASLHGALAQAEAYRLAVASERLAVELDRVIARIAAAATALRTDPAELEADSEALRRHCIAGLVLVLKEHQHWHMAVQPHRLKLG